MSGRKLTRRLRQVRACAFAAVLGLAAATAALGYYGYAVAFWLAGSAWVAALFGFMAPPATPPPYSPPSQGRHLWVVDNGTASDVDTVVMLRPPGEESADG